MEQDIILTFLLNALAVLIGVIILINNYLGNAFSSLTEAFGGLGIFYIVVLLNGILWGISRIASYLERIANVADNYEKNQGH